MCLVGTSAQALSHSSKASTYSAQHLYNAEEVAGPGTPVSRYYASFVAWPDQDTQPPESGSRRSTCHRCGRRHVILARARRRGSPRGTRQHARVTERGAAANGPYHAYRLTQVGGWRRCRRRRERSGGRLDSLAALGTERDRERLLALHDRLDAARLRVLVVGEAKRGKSTLINALLGRDVLPSGVTPLTAVATTVRYGDDSRMKVAPSLDGHQEKHSLTALVDFVTQVRNPRNKRMVAGIATYLDAPVLAGGVRLVDTPGTGSVFQWDTQAAHEALQTMDAAVFVLTADPPVSASERDLLGRVAELAVTTFAVLNKADHLDEAGLAEA